MKANRKFVQGDDAVSPVIAVILMVAITVVLAATVFVLVSDIGNQSAKNAPAVALNTDTGTRHLTVQSAATGANWNREAVRLKSITPAGTVLYLGQATAAITCEATPLHQNKAADATHGCPVAANSNTAVASASATMQPGDYLEFCTSAASTNVVISVVDTVASASVGDFTFTAIPACA